MIRVHACQRLRDQILKLAESHLARIDRRGLTLSRPTIGVMQVSNSLYALNGSLNLSFVRTSIANFGPLMMVRALLPSPPLTI